MSSEQNLLAIRDRLNEMSILFSEDSIDDKPTVIGYDKKFKWQWMATQLNTFIVACNFGDEVVSPETLQKVLFHSFGYAKLNYSGWPRGVQSSMAVIAIAISENIADATVAYCNQLRAKRSWAGFSIPVAIDASSDQIHAFRQNPLRGIIYYPYFRQLIAAVTKH